MLLVVGIQTGRKKESMAEKHLIELGFIQGLDFRQRIILF